MKIMITIPSAAAIAPGCVRPGEQPVMARYGGQLVAVGHVRHPATHYYRAVLWERAGQQQLTAERERIVIASTLTGMRQALRDYLRDNGRWWT